MQTDVSRIYKSVTKGVFFLAAHLLIYEPMKFRFVIKNYSLPAPWQDGNIRMESSPSFF